MRSMAAHAGRDARVPRGQPLAVDAGGVLGRLVDVLARGKTTHQVGITVAAGAGRNHSRAGRRAFEAARPVVRSGPVHGRAVPAVAVRAAEPVLTMDVLIGEQ